MSWVWAILSPFAYVAQVFYPCLATPIEPKPQPVPDTAFAKYCAENSWQPDPNFQEDVAAMTRALNQQAQQVVTALVVSAHDQVGLQSVKTGAVFYMVLPPDHYYLFESPKDLVEPIGALCGQYDLTLTRHRIRGDLWEFMFAYALSAAAEPKVD